MPLLQPVPGSGPALPRRPTRADASATVRRHPLLVALALAAAATVLLRAPGFHAVLGNDEGGLAYVARHWQEHGAFPYGGVFLDRPPLLVALFRVAVETGGTAAVRTLGLFFAGALVAVSTVLARELGGRRAMPWAAGIATVLASSVALGALGTPAELPAAVLSAGSILALVRAHTREEGRVGRLVAAGALASAALLLKQSFGDALAAGVAALIAAAWFERPGALALARRAAAYGAGVAAGGIALGVWEALAGVHQGAVDYALVGFRLEGLRSLAGTTDMAQRFGRLLPPLLASGLLLVLPWAWRGLRLAPTGRVIRIALAVWGLAAVVGILAGGSYWGHYWLELVPFAAALAAVGLARTTPRRAGATALVLAVFALGGVGYAATAGAALPTTVRGATIGAAIRRVAAPGDTIWVRYSEAEILYYSGLTTPYPYDWSLMLRTVPGAQPRLRRLLAGAHRPTWVVLWEHDTAYGLDRSGATARLLHRHYRFVARVARHRILLERGVRRPVPSSPGSHRPVTG